MDLLKDSHLHSTQLDGSFQGSEKPKVEAVRWVRAGVRDNHEWIFEFSLALQER